MLIEENDYVGFGIPKNSLSTEKNKTEWRNYQ